MRGHEEYRLTATTTAAALKLDEPKPAINQQGVRESFVKAFCECGGLTNVLKLLLNRTCGPPNEPADENRRLFETCMDLIVDLTTSNTTEPVSINVTTEFILANDEFAKACWLLIERANEMHEGLLQQKAINVNKSLISAYLVREDLYFSCNVLNCAYSVIKKYLNFFSKTQYLVMLTGFNWF
jgi:hypothetical protein